MYKPLISRQEIIDYLQTRPIVRDYLAIKKYSVCDFLDNKNLELWLACLMGKISEKEKRCIESIDSIVDSPSSFHENVFLVLKSLSDFWSVGVGLTRNSARATSSPNCASWTTSGAA